MPLLFSVVLSFMNWELQSQSREFVFFKNFVNVLHDTRYWASLRTTILIMVIAVSLELIIGLGMALTLIDPIPGKKIITSLLILPVVLAPVIVGYAWRILWDGQYSPINYLIGQISGRPFQLAWLANTKSVFPAVIITEVWQWTPFIFMMMLAGLSSINPEIHEAAKVDGASSWSILLLITLPLLRPLIILALLFRSLDIFKLFDIIFALTGGGPGTMTETTSLYVYTTGFKSFRLSYTAAMSLLLMVIMSVAIMLLLRQLAKRGVTL